MASSYRGDCDLLSHTLQTLQQLLQWHWNIWMISIKHWHRSTTKQSKAQTVSIILGKFYKMWIWLTKEHLPLSRKTCCLGDNVIGWFVDVMPCVHGAHKTSMTVVIDRATEAVITAITHLAGTYYVSIEPARCIHWQRTSNIRLWNHQLWF